VTTRVLGGRDIIATRILIAVSVLKAIAEFEILQRNAFPKNTHSCKSWLWRTPAVWLWNSCAASRQCVSLLTYAKRYRAPRSASIN